MSRINASATAQFCKTSRIADKACAAGKCTDGICALTLPEEGEAAKGPVGEDATPQRSAAGHSHRELDTGREDVREYQRYGNFDDRSYLTDRGRNDIASLLTLQLRRKWQRCRAVTGGGGTRRTGGGRARNPTDTAAEQAEKRAARDAIRAEEQLRDSMARTLRAQEDSVAVQRYSIRTGEVAAAAAEAELAFCASTRWP